MQYYKITNACEPEVIGVTTGLSQAELISKNFRSLEDYRELTDFFNFFTSKGNQSPPKEFNFEYIKLFKKAKVTDLISFAPALTGIKFILNSKAKRLLDGLKLPNCFFFKASIYTFNKIKLDDQFFVLYTTYHGFESINFSKTVFYSGNDLSGKTYYHFETYEEWKAHWEKPKRSLIFAEKIALKKEYVNSDFIQPRLGGLFVSERLLDRWTDFNLTGFEISKDQTLEIV